MLNINSAKIIANIREYITLERELDEKLNAEELLFYQIFDCHMTHKKKVAACEAMYKQQKLASIPVSDYLHTHFENQPTNAYALRSSLIYALDTKNVKEAKKLLHEFELLQGFDAGINLQFLLSHKTCLMNITKQSPKRILSLIKKAMAITFEGFDEENLKSALLYEEPRLIHTLALVRPQRPNRKSNKAV